jgi:serine protease AprX
VLVARGSCAGQAWPTAAWQSVGAAYGVMTLVAQGGALAELIGIDHEVPVAPFMPVMMFAILFGLSMDYEVFLISLCACIATGTRAEGGESDGVAPDAGVIACRTRFFDSEIVTIYHFLTDFATEHTDLRLVASNSFGRRTGSPPAPPPDTDLADALRDAVAAGVTICFSAGNYHKLAGGAPAACNPTSIWLHKCRDDLLTVATSRPDGSMWFYSSRGPGQFNGDPGMARKPDVTAPTPPNGRVVYGDSVQSLPDGWGTSGACPQVAGVAALMLGGSAASPAEVCDAIRSTAVPLGHDFDCEGRGLIHAARAVAAL